MQPEPIRTDVSNQAPLSAGAEPGASAAVLPYEAMFLASPLPASVSSLNDGRLIAVNDAWVTMTGRSRESVIGRNPLEFGLWPSETARQSFVDAIGSPSSEHTLHRASGETIRVRLHATRIDAAPQPLLLTYTSDITREVHAERAHEHSQQTLRETTCELERSIEMHSAAEKLARTGHWTYSADDQWADWSDGLYDITGLCRATPLLISEIYRHVHPEDQAQLQAARDACDGRAVDFRWLHPDGTMRWFRTRMGRTAVAGNAQTDFGVVQDITAERDARERLAEQLALLQSIAERVPGMVYRARLQPDGRSVITYINGSVNELLEATPAEVLADARVLFRRVHPEDFNELLASLNHSAKTLTVWRQSYRVCLPSGRTGWCWVEAAPQAEADGSVVWHGFVTDVTEARLAAQQLERQNRMLHAVRSAQAVYIESNDKRLAFQGLLIAFLQLTDSAYGFVGEVHYDDGVPHLRTHAVTNIAWDEASRQLYESQQDAGMVFRNLRTLFGRALVTGQPVIANAPTSDPRSGGLPPGHPPMDAFLGIPIAAGGRLVAMVGVANRLGGYTTEDIEFLQPLLGAVRQLVLAFRGHAERKRTLAELEATTRELTEKSATLQATLDSISQGLSKVDASGRVLIYNRRLLELLDLPDNLMAQHPTHGQIVAFQRERGDFGKAMELVDPEAKASLLQPGDMESPEGYWRKTRDGRTLDVFTRRLPDGGQVRTFSDVTPYVKAQQALNKERQRLQWVLEATRCGIWETNLETGLSTVNDHWGHMLGYLVEELQPISLDTWRSLVHPQDLGYAEEMLERHVRGETDFYEVDLRMRHKSGHWVWINDRGRVHTRDASGKALFMSGTHLDIHARVEAQEQVRLLNASLEQRVAERTAELERSMRDMEAISYSIAHDLRSPLRAINGFSVVISEEADTPLSPVLSDMLGRINGASRRMGQMLTDMLELLRVVRVELAAVPVDLHGMALTIANELAQETPQVEFVLGPLPTVLGDPILLRQVLHNLIENALKYSRHRSPPRLTLNFDESFGAFCLSDNGMGFDMDHAGKLFGLFQRLHPGSDVPGTGVGLAIVSRILERHGGRIWAESQPDHGAKFWWTLPRP